MQLKLTDIWEFADNVGPDAPLIHFCDGNDLWPEERGHTWVLMSKASLVRLRNIIQLARARGFVGVEDWEALA